MKYWKTIFFNKDFSFWGSSWNNFRTEWFSFSKLWFQSWEEILELHGLRAPGCNWRVVSMVRSVSLEQRCGGGWPVSVKGLSQTNYNEPHINVQAWCLGLLLMLTQSSVPFMAPDSVFPDTCLVNMSTTMRTKALCTVGGTPTMTILVLYIDFVSVTLMKTAWCHRGSEANHM